MLPKKVLLIILFGFQFLLNKGANIDPDSTRQTVAYIIQQRIHLKEIKDPEERIQKMLDLGLWDEVNQKINTSQKNTSILLLKAEWFFNQSEFFKSEHLVDSILNLKHNNASALILKTRLLIEAWKLKEAENIASNLFQHNPKNVVAQYLLSNIFSLQGQQAEAEKSAKDLTRNFPESPWGYLLMGKWELINNSPKQADSLFKIGLGIDPINADLQFYYGYTKWRLRQGSFLQEMKNHWDICLMVNPLHFLAHWHLGNGHTNIGNFQYQSARDSSVKIEIKPFDLLFGQKRYEEAKSFAESLRHKYPKSTIPTLYKASAYYMMGSLIKENAEKNLDSSILLFQELLSLHTDLGTAHNGLAAVIKAKRAPYLYFYDSVRNDLERSRIENSLNFKEVFTEFAYFPELVEKMISKEIMSAKAYLPLLKKGDFHFHIMPLHHNLAETMQDPYFNTGITFDHRRWMDIRGVGSGAVGVEYVQKAAYYERNVFLHEFMHLIHANLITENDQRRIRRLYLASVQNHRSIDYYAAANEEEYFAQIYPAYFSERAVHPMDFKSYNTQKKLITVDPEGFKFIDSLVKVEKEYLAGNQQVFKNQWCELYIHLAGNLGSATNNFRLAKAYLDSANQWNKNYLPLLMARVVLAIQSKDFDVAEKTLKLAEELWPNASEVYEKNAEFNNAINEAGLLENSSSFELQKSYLIKAISVETDPVVLFDLKRKLIAFYKENALIPDALKIIQSLVETKNLYSSDHLEAKNEVQAELAEIRASLGYPEESKQLEKITEKESENYFLQLELAKSYVVLGKESVAMVNLQKLMEEQEHWGIQNREMGQYLAYLEAKNGNFPMATFLHNQYFNAPTDSTLLEVKYLLATNSIQKAESLYAALPTPRTPLKKSEYEEVRGDIQTKKNQLEEAISSYQQAFLDNAYAFSVANKLVALYQHFKRTNSIQRLCSKIKSLEIKPGSLAGLVSNLHTICP